MVLRFRSVIRAALVAHSVQTHCWAVLPQGHGLLCLSLPAEEAGGGQGLRGDTAGKAVPNHTKNTLCHGISHSEIKPGEGRESSKVAITQRLTGHQSAGGTWWGIAFATLGWCFFFLLFFLFFPLFNELSLPHSDSSPSPPGKEGTRGVGAYLAGRVNPTTVCTWFSTWCCPF